MNLNDIHYFSIKKIQHPPVFDLANKVVEISTLNTADNTEIHRRIALLSRAKDAEHIRQCTNFLAEIAAFYDLSEKGVEPHWVAETKRHRMPDITYIKSSFQVPIEVKHLNSPREEHDALFTVGTYGGSVDKNYHIGLIKKISDFINDAKAKFISFNAQVNGNNAKKGILYIYFSKSIDAGLLDGIEWEENMLDRVTQIAQHLAGDEIELMIADIDELFTCHINAV